MTICQNLWLGRHDAIKSKLISSLAWLNASPPKKTMALPALPKKMALRASPPPPLMPRKWTLHLNSRYLHCLKIQPSICSFFYSFIHPLIHSFIRSFTHSFSYSFIHSIILLNELNVEQQYITQWKKPSFFCHHPQSVFSRGQATL